MPQEMQAVPVKIGQIGQEALDDALDIVVSSGDAREVAAALRENPRLVARRVFRMNPFQYAALSEMSDEQLQEMLAPLVRELEGDNPARVRAILREEVTHESPLKCSCKIEIET